MSLHNAHQEPGIRAALASPTTTERPIYLTVEQFCARNPAWTLLGMRNLIFRAQPRQSSKGAVPGNGLAEAGAIVRLGKRVLIDEGRFLGWVAQGGKPQAAQASQTFAKAKTVKQAAAALADR